MEQRRLEPSGMVVGSVRVLLLIVVASSALLFGVLVTPSKALADTGLVTAYGAEGVMLNKGEYGGERILSRPTVEVMTVDHLTPEQKAGAEMFFGDNSSWGFGMSVVTKRDDLTATPGRFGWDGGYGTSGYSDPEEDLVGVLMTQRLAGPDSPRIDLDFWTSAYGAIDD